SAHTLFAMRDMVGHGRHESRYVTTGGVREVATDRAARVRQSLWMVRGPGMQKDTGTLARTCGEHHDARRDVAVFPRGLVDVRNTGGQSVATYSHLPHHRVGQ